VGRRANNLRKPCGKAAGSEHTTWSQTIQGKTIYAVLRNEAARVGATCRPRRIARTALRCVTRIFPRPQCPKRVSRGNQWGYLRASRIALQRPSSTSGQPPAHPGLRGKGAGHGGGGQPVRALHCGPRREYEATCGRCSFGAEEQVYGSTSGYRGSCRRSFDAAIGPRSTSPPWDHGVQPTPARATPRESEARGQKRGLRALRGAIDRGGQAEVTRPSLAVEIRTQEGNSSRTTQCTSRNVRPQHCQPAHGGVRAGKGDEQGRGSKAGIGPVVRPTGESSERNESLPCGFGEGKKERRNTRTCHGEIDLARRFFRLDGGQSLYSNPNSSIPFRRRAGSGRWRGAWQGEPQGPAG